MCSGHPSGGGHNVLCFPLSKTERAWAYQLTCQGVKCCQFGIAEARQPHCHVENDSAEHVIPEDGMILAFFALPTTIAFAQRCNTRMKSLWHGFALFMCPGAAIEKVFALSA
jgi:hypothetical protein